MFSPHTNRPITSIEPNPIFWCGICSLKLKNACMALQHIRGRVHRAKINTDTNTANQSNQNNNIGSSKLGEFKSVTKISTSIVKEQAVKGAVFDRKCDVCKLVFDSSIIALHHFQGKKHADAAQSYLSTINPPKVSGNQSNAKIHNVIPRFINPRQVGLVAEDFQFTKSQVQPAKTATLNKNHTQTDHNLGSVTIPMQQNKGKKYNTAVQNETKKKNVANPSNQADTLKGNHFLNKKNTGHDAQEYPKVQVPLEQKKAVVPDPNLTCDACSVEFNSIAMAIQHYKGKNHAQTVLSKQNEASCVPNRKHLLELSEDEKPTGHPVEDTPAKKCKEESSTKDANEDKLKRCHDCNILFTCELSANQHYAGKKHSKTVIAIKAAAEREIMMRWQGRDGATKGIRSGGSDRGRGRGIHGSQSNRDQYRNILLGRKEVSSDNLLRKAILPSKLRALMNAAAQNTVASGPVTHKHLQLRDDQNQSERYSISQNAMHAKIIQPTLRDYYNDRTVLPASKGNLNVGQSAYGKSDDARNVSYNSNGSYAYSDIGNSYQMGNSHIKDRYSCENY